MTASIEPYLSVVVATRNDDHGGDPLKRLQAFLNTFGEQCRRSSLSAEVIVVEWNPPAERPRVAELCRVPAEAPFDVRFIEVDAGRHQALRFASVLPLFQMIAKNAGIRRARGRFILATNIDIIFSNELVDQLASRSLTPGVMYRVDRHDIEPNFPVDGTLAEKMAYCASHHLRLHTRLGTYPVDSIGRPATLTPDIAGPGVTLTSGWHPREGDPISGFYRWATGEATLSVDGHGNGGRGAAVDIELEANPYQAGAWVDVEILDGSRSLGRYRVTRRICLRVPLDDVRPLRELTMRMLDSSGGRQSMPLFESRDQMAYRVFRVAPGPATMYEGDMRLWRRATNSNPLLQVEHASSGVEITSDPGSYTYCAQYGPFEARADQKYEFLVEYIPVSGQVMFNLMDERSQLWLPVQTAEILSGDKHMLGLSADLARGTRFSLVVSNNLPAGGASRCVLRATSASVPFDQLVTRDLPRPRARWVATWFDLTARPFRWLRSAVTSFEKRRAQRFHEHIADESERVRDLEARVSALAPLSELAPLAQLLRDQRPAPLHQNACGDFQLMAREHWHDLRGYPEFEMFSMGLDGLFESMAHAAGIREHIFETPRCIYHLEHEKGSGWTPEGEAALRKRIAESGITWLDASTVHVWTMYMGWLRRPMIFNSADWGFGDAPLAEAVVRPPAHASGTHVSGDVG